MKQSMMRAQHVMVSIAALTLAGCNAGSVQAPTGQAAGTPEPIKTATSDANKMYAIASEDELRALLAKSQAAEQLDAVDAAEAAADGSSMAIPAPPPVIPPPVIPPPTVSTPAPAAEPVANAVAKTASGASPNITNRQEADVDEGGIVKVHGNHLVVLRRGRLFTVDVSTATPRKVDQIDAFPPDGEGQAAWYDEMLISGDRVIVIGFNYARMGTEINRLKIDGSGHFTYIDTHHLRSEDYYSSRNYASRLIGSRLIVYAPLPAWLDPRQPVKEILPGLRKWDNTRAKDFTPTLSINKIYVPEPLRTAERPQLSMLHSVTDCDLAAPVLRCSSTAVLGNWGRNFYVSSDAVYVWTDGVMAAEGIGDAQRALVYRLPLDGSRPSAAQAFGAPVDQFSFKEDKAGRLLNVMVLNEGSGDGMGGPEMSGGQNVALLRLPMARFGSGSAAPDRKDYRALPTVRGWGVQNRFVGDYLLYGVTTALDDDGRPQHATGGVHVLPVSGGAVTWVPTGHNVTRIDQMGSDGIVIGNDAKGALGFSAIGLNAAPSVLDRYFLPNASEGENRSHAYFYRPDDGSKDGTSGILGLPVSRQIEPRFARLLGSGSAILFLRRNDRRFAPAGTLDADARKVSNDNCIASCVDWYGNARPIFLGSRIFALMGYELVEGTVSAGRIREVNRTNFAPVNTSKKR